MTKKEEKKPHKGKPKKWGGKNTDFLVQDVSTAREVRSTSDKIRDSEVGWDWGSRGGREGGGNEKSVTASSAACH